MEALKKISFKTKEMPFAQKLIAKICVLIGVVFLMGDFVNFNSISSIISVGIISLIFLFVPVS